MKLVTPEQVQNNIGTLAQFAARGAAPGTYFESLNLVQNYQLRFHSHGRGPYVDFDLSDPKTRCVLDSLLRSPEYESSGPVEPVPVEERETILKRLESARHLLLGYSPDAAELVNQLIAWIIPVRKEGYVGGSFWHVLGAIWMSPSAAWTVTDYAENLLHETVHQAMFLDDMVHGLFSRPPEELATEDAQVVSSIRGTKRSYEFSFHAATVSVALIDFYEHLNRKDKATEFCSPLLQTLSELEARRQFLNPRGLEVLGRMLALVEKSDTFAAMGIGLEQAGR